MVALQHQWALALGASDSMHRGPRGAGTGARVPHPLGGGDQPCDAHIAP